MAKLKALRGGIGGYGRVKANGIVEVSETDAKVLLATKRFVVATEADIAAAREAQDAFLKVETKGATAGFAPMPDMPLNQDRLTAMIDSGQVSREKAKELVALQINLSDGEIRSFLEGEIASLLQGLQSRSTELDDRAAEIAEREKDLEARENAYAEAVDAQDKALLARAEELDALGQTLDARQKDLDRLENAAKSGPAEDAAATQSAADASHDEDRDKPKAPSGAKSAK